MEVPPNHLLPPRTRPARRRNAAWSLKPKTVRPGGAAATLGSRYYSLGLGRWVSRDPMGEEGGANLQGFARDEPIGQIDLLGFVDLSGVTPVDAEHLQPTIRVTPPRAPEVVSTP